MFRVEILHRRFGAKRPVAARFDGRVDEDHGIADAVESIGIDRPAVVDGLIKDDLLHGGENHGAAQGVAGDGQRREGTMEGDGVVIGLIADHVEISKDARELRLPLHMVPHLHELPIGRRTADGLSHIQWRSYECSRHLPERDTQRIFSGLMEDTPRRTSCAVWRSWFKRTLLALTPAITANLTCYTTRHPRHARHQ
ncbi:MAG: hypothetical protein ACRD3J_25065 [Thermoanaerobaculia bacterium]